MVAGLGEAEATRIVFRIAGEDVAAALEVAQRHIEMRAIAGAVGKRLRHHRRNQTFLLGIVFRHHAEEGDAVASRQGIGIGEVELILAAGVLVVEGIQVPAEVVDDARHLVEPGEIAHEAAHVVAGLDQLVVGIGRVQRAIGCLLQDEDLAFDAEVEAEAHLGCLGDLLLQRNPGRERIWFAMERQVCWRPRELRLPRQLNDMGEVRHRGKLVLVRLLAEAIQRVAGVEFGAIHHMRQMIDRDDLALLRAMDVDIGADNVFHALVAQVVLQGGHTWVFHHDVHEAVSVAGAVARCV